MEPDDTFAPPKVPVEVGCLHCQQTYESYLIEWREYTDEKGNTFGFWCCPMPGCDGKGFGFDIFPTDPEYRDERTGELMWCSDEEDDEDYDLLDDDGTDAPDSPAPNGRATKRPSEDDDDMEIPF
ncbi:MAG TPA: hypothetical protein VKS79_26765 [Gemmataceae bacterium]|nr:hypothetical protein [Gemmataceae bacterium]